MAYAQRKQEAFQNPFNLDAAPEYPKQEAHILRRLYTEKDYDATPEGVHVELIDGVFYDMASPNRVHQEILGFLYLRIGNYIASRHGSCKAYPAPFAVKLFPEEDTTIVEPDISVICDRSKLTEKGCTGAPDWVIEIASPSNEKHDFVEKLELYQRAGVREYWIVNPMDKQVFVYQTGQPGAGKAEPDLYHFTDKIKAGIYADLWIDMAELAMA